MKPSAWLLAAAECFHRRKPLPSSLLDEDHARAMEFLAKWMPEGFDFTGQELDETRVLRFLFASAMAKGEGE